MTMTNGAGEPSMEEILASIRNIIAEDPPSQEAGGNRPAGNDVPQTAPRTAAGSSSGARPGAPTGAAPSEPRANLDLRTTAAAGLLPPVDKSDLGAVADQAVDDFSDVFEEPLQRISPAPTVVPAAKAETGTGSGFRPGEPQLPRGTNGAGLANGTTAPSSMPPQRPQSSAAGLSPSPRKEFDFGALRPPRKDDTQAALEASEIFGGIKPSAEKADAGAAEPAERSMDASDGLRAPTAEPTRDGDTAEPARKVVIAAMPASGVPSPEPAEPAVAAQLQSGAVEPEAKDRDPSSRENPPAANGESSLKNSNVGFLSATPRPIAPEEAKSTNTGRAFFDAVAGETQSGTVFPPAAADVEDQDRVTDEPARDVEVAAGTEPEGEVKGSSEPAREKAAGGGTAAGDTDVDADEPTDEPVSSDTTAAQQADAPGQALAQGLSVSNIVVSNEGGKVRTLEDTVAELLRPLLREWLENNMPRIVESALKLEVADSVKKQLENTSGKPNGIAK